MFFLNFGQISTILGTKAIHGEIFKTEILNRVCVFYEQRWWQNDCSGPYLSLQGKFVQVMGVAPCYLAFNPFIHVYVISSIK